VTVVLDSWAVLRYLENTEPAASLVADGGGETYVVDPESPRAIRRERPALSV
jgi:hypothetical protein